MSSAISVTLNIRFAKPQRHMACAAACQGGAAPSEFMRLTTEKTDAQKNLERFGALVLADRELQHRLRTAANEPEFVALTVQLAAERGLIFEAPTVVAALREQQRRLRESWL
jgi:hypothetical protein